MGSSRLEDPVEFLAELQAEVEFDGDLLLTDEYLVVTLTFGP